MNRMMDAQVPAKLRKVGNALLFKNVPLYVGTELSSKTLKNVMIQIRIQMMDALKIAKLKKTQFNIEQIRRSIHFQLLLMFCSQFQLPLRQRVSFQP